MGSMAKCQVNFGDPRWLQTPKREGRGLLWLAKACKDRERAYNTTGGPTPTT